MSGKIIFANKYIQINVVLYVQVVNNINVYRKNVVQFIILPYGLA